jgi:hypothetical protein
MLTRRLDIYASVDLTRLVRRAGISIEELAQMADAATPPHRPDRPAPCSENRSRPGLSGGGVVNRAD